MEIEERKKSRLAFLQKLYKVSNGKTTEFVNMYKLGQELGLTSKEDVYAIGKYLHDKGLIKILTMDGEIQIQSRGIDEIEEAEANPNMPTEFFPPINIINVGSITNSSILQGASNSVENFNFNSINSKEKEKIIREEAIEFCFEQAEYCAESYKGHIKFIDLVKSELNRFYDVESKILYLDQVKTSVKAYKQNHNAGCPDPNNCDTDKTYDRIIFLLDQEFQILPKILHRPSNTLTPGRTKVFISYAHKDKMYLDELRKHFKPIEKYVEIWDDSKLEPGHKWDDKIKEAIEHSKIAILLISADFFNSDYITNNELPPLLRAAQNEGATILSIILKPCMLDEYPEIKQYQAINDPNLPILGMDEVTRENTWLSLVKQIKRIATDSAS